MKRLLCLVAMLLGLAACVPAYTGNPAGPKVGILGDSITNDAAEQFHATLDPAYQVSVYGQDGMRSGEAFGWADGYAATNPWAMVVELGTNDAWYHAPTWRSDMTTVLNKFGHVPCRVWVTINTNTPYAGYNTVGAEINAWMRSRGWRIVEWDATVANYIANGSPWGPLTVDTIHPSAFGSLILASMVQDALAGCPR